MSADREKRAREPKKKYDLGMSLRNINQFFKDDHEVVKLFWSKVTKTNECWYWFNGNEHRYGRFVYKNRRAQPHHFSFILSGREIPEGYVVDHVCRVRNCVKPRHLRVLSQRENLLSGSGPTAINARKLRCSKGHPFSITYCGARYCHTCRAEWQRNDRREKKILSLKNTPPNKNRVNWNPPEAILSKRVWPVKKKGA